MNQKALLRRAMREKLREQTTADRAVASRKIGAHLLSLSLEWQSVIAFLAQAREPDLDETLRTLMARGASVAAPHMREGGAAFCAIAPDWDNIHLNALGWREPQQYSGSDFKVNAADAIFLPGLAFDLAGNRLGQGGGWYDRVLENLSPRVLRVGVCFEFQIVESLPREAHDQIVSIIATDQRIFYV